MVRVGKSGRDKATVQVTVNPTKGRRSSDE
jgi:hypothetical protein